MPQPSPSTTCRGGSADEPHQPWLSPWFGAGGQLALPTGALTTITLGDRRTGRPGHWPTAVLDLAQACVLAGRPVVYTHWAGSTEPAAICWTGRWLTRCCWSTTTRT